MPRYNHMVLVAFTVISSEANGKDITDAMLKEALLKRIGEMDNEGTWEEACLPVEDTYREDKVTLIPAKLCWVCLKPQYETPSGPSCDDGHGGADGVNP